MLHLYPHPRQKFSLSSLCGARPLFLPCLHSWQGGLEGAKSNDRKEALSYLVNLILCLESFTTILGGNNLYNDDRKAFGCPFEASLEPTEAVNPITTCQPAGTEHLFLVQQVLSDDLNAAADSALVVFSEHGFLCNPADSSGQLGRWDRTLNLCKLILAFNLFPGNCLFWKLCLTCES